jgi:WD40 repeat protein
VSVPNASIINFRRGQDVAGLSFTGLGEDGNVNLFSVSSTNVIADVTGYFTGNPNDDEGVHPVACENIKQFNPRTVTGWNTTVLRDRTGVHPDVVIGVAFGLIVGNCDFVAVSSYNRDDGSYRIDRYSLGGRLIGNITPHIVYWSAAWSPDGRYLFTTEGFSGTVPNPNARTVYRTDVYTGDRTLIYDAKANTIRNIENVGSTGRILHITIGSPTTAYTEYLLNLDNSQLTAVKTPGVHPYRISLSPDGLLLTLGEIFPGGFAGPITTCLVSATVDNCTQVSGVWSTFTPQNELFVIDQYGHATKYNLLSPNGTFQNDTGKAFPSDPYDGYTYFPTYALV